MNEIAISYLNILLLVNLHQKRFGCKMSQINKLIDIKKWKRKTLRVVERYIYGIKKKRRENAESN